jgi:hypothetical protein
MVSDPAPSRRPRFARPAAVAAADATWELQRVDDVRIRDAG